MIKTMQVDAKMNRPLIYSYIHNQQENKVIDRAEVHLNLNQSKARPTLQPKCMLYIQEEEVK